MFRFLTPLIGAAVLLAGPAFAQQPNSAAPTQQPSSQQAQPPTSAPQTQSAPQSSLPDSPDQNVKPALQPTGPTVLFDTSMGRMTCRLFDKEAPNAVANFVGLATGTKEYTDPQTKKKVKGVPFYDGTTFHRVIPEFMIQGGDRVGNGEGDPGYYINDEFNPNLNFDVPGRLAYANSGPNTNGSQFFVTEGPAEYLNRKYTIFGQCDEHSVLVVQSIARVNRNAQDKPIEPVLLKKVTIIPGGQPVPPEPPSQLSASPQ